MTCKWHKNNSFFCSLVKTKGTEQLVAPFLPSYVPHGLTTLESHKKLRKTQQRYFKDDSIIIIYNFSFSLFFFSSFSKKKYQQNMYLLKLQLIIRLYITGMFLCLMFGKLRGADSRKKPFLRNNIQKNDLELHYQL